MTAARLEERTRPLVHFAAGQGWINDPYGLTWTGDRYHLFFQAVPDRVTWSPQAQWGHAESVDLVHWRELPTALQPGPFEVGCWSGTFVLDDSGVPTILYTRVASADWGQGQIALAHGDSTARTWRTSVDDCVVPGPPPEVRAHSFRDPFVWRTDAGWTMVVGAGLASEVGAVLQYSSPDLVDWHYDGVVCSRPSSTNDQVWTGSLWECPQLFRLGADWVLLVSVWHQDTLHHVAAALGAYDGHTFQPQSWQQLTYGSSAYAMTAFVDRHGARCVMSWLREEPQNDPQRVGWVGAHSVASRLELDDRGRLHLVPHADVEASFAALVDLPPASAEAARAQLEAVALLVEAQVSAGADITIRDSEGVRLRLSVEPAADGAAIRLQRPGHDDIMVPGRESADADIRILLDADLAEVFGPTGYAAARLRSTRDPVIDLTWTTRRPPLIRTLGSEGSVGVSLTHGPGFSISEAPGSR